MKQIPAVIILAVSLLCTGCMSVTVVKYKADPTPEMPGVIASLNTNASRY